MEVKPESNGRTCPYSPVDPDFIDLLEKLMGRSGKINFFNYSDQLEDTEGELTSVISNQMGDFAELNEQVQVRLDQIVTVFGKPGPAYEKYDHYANACFSCFDEGQF